jgi:hemerythrin-like domain-containing protein
MLKTGVPRENGPVRVMLSEHGQGWIFVRAMRAGAEKWQAGHFERIEQEETGEGVHEKYLMLAEKLENQI